MPFSIRQLRYFVAVAEAEQISAASRELYASQSSVTTAIQEIERHLHQRLFTRGSRGVALTPIGTQFLQKARQILELVEEASLVTASDAELHGHVRVGVSYTVMAHFLPHHLQRLTVVYPHLTFTWLEMGRPEVEDKLTSGSLDFGLLLTSNVANPDLKHETFVHSKRRLWMAPSHPLAHQSEIGLADVAEHPYAQLTVDEAEETTHLYWSRRGVSPRTFVQTSSIEAVRSIVANGNSITILSDMVFRPWSLEGKRVTTAILSDPIPDMQIGLAWRRNVTFTPAMTALHQYFHRQFSQPESPPA